MKIYSWNVNSLRNAETHFLEFMTKYKPDIIFLQEIRAREDQLSFFLKLIDGYNVLFNPAERPGYSGTAVYYKNSLELSNLSTKSDYKYIDIEGRFITCTVNGIQLNNFYIPNGNSNQDRLDLKLAYHKSILQMAKDNLKNKVPTIFTGDFNVAHTEKDLFNPNGSNFSGFLKEERNWFDNLLSLGYLDSFRKFNQQDGYYTWWNLGDKTRKMNRGWRFDYFIASKDLNKKIINSNILKNVFGSDHCPVMCELIL